MAGRLEGLTAVVTGAGGGHGRAVALGFNAEGAKVVVNDLGADAFGTTAGAPRAQEVADEILALGDEAIADDGDIGDLTRAEALIAKAVTAWGKLDILVNVAGTVRLGTISETTPADLESQVHVHLRGYYNTAHAAAKHWVERGEYGRLINFTSSAGYHGSYPTLLAYSVAKGGTLGLTLACANGLAAYNVTANGISPNGAGLMGDALAYAKRMLEETGKPPSELAKGTEYDPVSCVPLAVYLASPRAANVSGRIFTTFGGRYELVSVMAAERRIDVDFLEQPERVYEAIEAELTGDISLRDLRGPLARFEVIGDDWRDTYGPESPRWDFATAAAGAVR